MFSVVVSFYPFKSGISFTNLSFTNNVNSFYNVLGYIVTQCHNMDEFVEFVKVLFLKVMQLCKSICASRTLRCCFERYELVRTTGSGFVTLAL